MQQKPILREQIAQQPGTYTPRRAVPQEPPSWMNQLERPDASSRRKMAPRLVRTEPPPNVPPRSEAPSQPEALPEQQAFPRLDADRPIPELRVKIWNQDTVQTSSAPAEAGIAPVPQEQEQEQAIELLPTSPLSRTPIEGEVPSQEGEMVEEQPTGPLLVPSPPIEQLPPWQAPVAQRVQDERDQMERLPPWHARQDERVQYEEPGPISPALPPSPPVGASPLPLSRPGTGGVAPHRKRRGPLMLLALLLLLLVLLGAGGTWLWLAQPFSVPAVTQPYQTLSDSALSFTLRYPHDWGMQRKANPATITLSDTTQTAQVVLMVANAGGGQINMQQQGAKAGLTSVKPGAVAATTAFGGVTWQQVQGTIQQSGATYTGTLLATIYKQRLYTMMQLAPQSVYAQEEEVNFSPMRSSFQFLG